MKTLLNKCKGFCEGCGEPLGYLSSEQDKIFCYKCKNYRKLDLGTSLKYIEKKIEELRVRFRCRIIDEDIRQYLITYAVMGDRILSSENFHYVPSLPKDINSQIQWDMKNFVVSNIAIKWILEDLKFKSINSNEVKLSDSINLMNITKIIFKWLIQFRNKTFLENYLGIIIQKKNGKKYFYYFQKLKFYDDSLIPFGIIDPQRVKKDTVDQIYNEMLRREKDPNFNKELNYKQALLTFVMVNYLQYPNIKNRIFSFNDIFKNTLIADTIPKIISIISEFYDNSRKLYFKLFNEELYYVVRILPQLRYDLNRLPWCEKLESLIITSKDNPINFPLLIKYNEEVIITPSRLKFAQRLMEEKLDHKDISIKLSDFSGISFQKKIEKILEEKGVNIKDPINKETWNNIEKKNSFEIDILGTYKDFIFVVECKSFHPHPFFRLKNFEHSLKRKKKFIHKENLIKTKIIPWLVNQLSKNSKGQYIKLECLKQDFTNKDKSNKYIINFPIEYHKIIENRIISLYITQLNECFNSQSNVIQLYYEDLDDFFERLNNNF